MCCRTHKEQSYLGENQKSAQFQAQNISAIVSLPTCLFHLVHSNTCVPGGKGICVVLTMIHRGTKVYESVLCVCLCVCVLKRITDNFACI